MIFLQFFIGLSIFVLFFTSEVSLFSVLFFTSDLTFITQRQKWCSHIQNNWKTWYRSSRSQRFFKIGVLKTSQTSQENICVGVSFKKVAGLKLCKIVKKETPRQVFPVNFSKFLRTPLFTEHLRWLLLVIISLTPDSLHWVNRRFCLNALLF